MSPTSSFFRVLPWLFRVGPACRRSSCGNVPGVFRGSSAYKPVENVLHPQKYPLHPNLHPPSGGLQTFHEYEALKTGIMPKMQRAEKPFRADFLKLAQPAELQQLQESFSACSLVIFQCLAFVRGSTAEASKQGQSNVAPNALFLPWF